MERKAIDFSIQETGCLLYAADANLGGKPFNELHHSGWQDLTLKGALIGTSLYQDDGYNVRVLFGDLTVEEKSEWTGSVAWKLNLESGKMVVSGVCDEDLEDYMKDFPTAGTGGAGVDCGQRLEAGTRSALPLPRMPCRVRREITSSIPRPRRRAIVAAVLPVPRHGGARPLPAQKRDPDDNQTVRADRRAGRRQDRPGRRVAPARARGGARGRHRRDRRRR